MSGLDKWLNVGEEEVSFDSQIARMGDRVNLIFNH